jgi:ribose 5-phosphate isomerase A
MKWDKELQSNLEWSSEITNYAGKLEVAKAVALKVRDGDVIGFGSGSTSFLAANEIAKRVKQEGISIRAVPTSREISFACSELGIPVASLNDERPDWSFDGADEVDPDGNLIKGRGGAMFNEKLVMRSSLKCYILVDESKFVDKMGSKAPVPVEIHQDALMYVKMKLSEMDAVKSMKLRMAQGKDGPVITENGNFILDVAFEDIKPDLEKDLKSITGVIETGLFLGYPIEIIKVG